MPREASQCRGWEKERRNRLNHSFEELAKVLPSHDPSIKISKLETLNQARDAIVELKQEVNDLLSSDKSKQLRDDQIKKLQDRIKKLITRNEQLTKLFKDAGIKPPKVVGSVKQFKKKQLWSKRISKLHAKVIKKEEVEKENLSCTSSKTIIQKLANRNPSKSSKANNNQIKTRKPTKPNKQAPTPNNLFVLSPMQTVPTLKQQLVLVQNTPLPNVSRGSALLKVSPTKTVKSAKPIKALAPVNLGTSSLGPGTLILGNGNIISLLPQPQIVIPPLTIPSPAIIVPKKPKKPRPNLGVDHCGIKKNHYIQSKECITKTTQVIKVPIPALTSKYTNPQLLLNSSRKSDLKRRIETKKSNKTCKSGTVTKRKAVVKNEEQSKKIKNQNSNMEKKETDTEIIQNKEPDTTENHMSPNNVVRINGPETQIPDSGDAGVKITESDNLSADLNDTGINPENLQSVETCSILRKDASSLNTETTSTPDKDLGEVNQPTNISTQNEMSGKAIENVSAVTPPCSMSNETQHEKPLSDVIPTSSTNTSQTSSSTLTVTSIINTSLPDDAIKNMDLNLVHSDLSNDIFASLQVPPGCQNTESTSPTAAFLLAFPLVSSIKVTEVIDEENSDSQRETPTLLQIGSMDNSKPSHNDSLLNLDNFPFFNSKDICTNYYGSKVEAETSDINIVNNKNSEIRSVAVPASNPKVESETFSIYGNSEKQIAKDIESNIPNADTSTYGMFPKSESQVVLGSKAAANKNSKKIDEAASIANHVVNNDQYILYEERKKEDSTHVFQQNESGKNLKIKHFPETRHELGQIIHDKNIVNNKILNNTSFDILPNKLEATCSALSNIPQTNYNISQEDTVHPLAPSSNYGVNENILYKNYGSKNELSQLPKQIKVQESAVNAMQYIYKHSNGNKDMISGEYGTDSKTVLNPIKQFNHKEPNLNMSCNAFPSNSMKDSELSIQHLETCNNKSDTNKIPDSYQYNPFEIRTSKQIVTNLPDNCNKSTNSNDKDRMANKISELPKRVDGVSSKSGETKVPCYFSSNYSNSSCTSNYRSDTSKVCPSCSYETQRNYSTPFYTNCNYNYNYTETNINQNYYKPDTKTCYSLNYENYQDYRKADTSVINNNFAKERRNSTLKDKAIVHNKPINWMTTEQKSQPPECFLPSFTNQSYSFTSCISTDTTDANNVGDTKKVTDLVDKRFSWSPTKLPNFLEQPHNFITPTLPTLVGDLALGNPLPVNESKVDYKYSKEIKKKTTYDNQANFLSVSQLVNQNKTDVPARTMTRRLSGSKSKGTLTTKTKRFDKTVDKTTAKPVNNFDIFYEQKNRNSNKNVISNYSAEALIGNQGPQEPKKCVDNSTKALCSSNFLTENIVPYFTTVDDGFMNQNQNFHNTYTHNSFQNNTYSANSFIYTAPPISSSYLSNTFESASHEYSADNAMNYCGLKDNKNCAGKNYRTMSKEDKTSSYSNPAKKIKRMNQNNSNSLGNFEYPLLPIQGSTNSPILPDDFQSHSTFLPPTTPYSCKNSLYQKQGNEFNSGSLLPLPGITRNTIQHPQISPSLNPVGTSLTNFNLSTIFPEINKGNIPSMHNSSSKSKNNSSFLEGSFGTDSKYGFST